jgi:hypothetical protein
MNIQERLQLALDGGIDSWPIASIEWEYAEAIKEIASLKSQLAECKKDAERYRYLRDENGETYREGALFVGFDDETGGDWIGADLDAVIDAAMAQKEE